MVETIKLLCNRLVKLRSKLLLKVRTTQDACSNHERSRSRHDDRNDSNTSSNSTSHCCHSCNHNCALVMSTTDATRINFVVTTCDAETVEAGAAIATTDTTRIDNSQTYRPESLVVELVVENLAEVVVRADTTTCVDHDRGAALTITAHHGIACALLLCLATRNACIVLCCTAATIILLTTKEFFAHIRDVDGWRLSLDDRRRRARTAPTSSVASVGVFNSVAKFINQAVIWTVVRGC